MDNIDDHVFGFADKVIERTDLLHERRELSQRIFEIKNKCGSCEFWNKSRLCHKEINVNGYSRGPSCGDMKCNKFTISGWYEYLLKKSEDRLVEVNKLLGG